MRQVLGVDRELRELPVLIHIHRNLVALVGFAIGAFVCARAAPADASASQA